jgi:hypothetical protein
MTKCKEGYCFVGIFEEFRHSPSETIIEADLKREGNDVLENVHKFKFCPECEHKIDWDRIKKELEDYSEKLKTA